MSPEMISQRNSTTKVDMWALGIILYQVLSKGKHPFEASSSFLMYKKICEY
jgi:serine/threonine protein kinase